MIFILTKIHAPGITTKTDLVNNPNLIFSDAWIFDVDVNIQSNFQNYNFEMGCIDKDKIITSNRRIHNMQEMEKILENHEGEKIKSQLFLSPNITKVFHKNIKKETIYYPIYISKKFDKNLKFEIVDGLTGKKHYADGLNANTISEENYEFVQKYGSFVTFGLFGIMGSFLFGTDALLTYFTGSGLQF